MLEKKPNNFIQYDELLEKYNQYLKDSVKSKQLFHHDIRKGKEGLETFYRNYVGEKLKKLEDERSMHQRKIKKAEDKYQRQKSKYEEMIREKDQKIKDLGLCINMLQKQKIKIHEEHQRLLIELRKSRQSNQIPSHNYESLKQLYDQILWQNNQLQKKLLKRQGRKQGESKIKKKNKHYSFDLKKN